jgi:DNA-binding response OmpR family regulator
MSDQPNAPYILVVDDDWTGRELLETYLKMGGYRVGLANSGEKALEMAFAEPPALVMLDVRLTDMDGLEVCRRLRDDTRTRSVPVLLVTAFDSEEDQQQATEAGANGFIAKPFEPQVMLAQVQSVLKKA